MHLTVRGSIEAVDQLQLVADYGNVSIPRAVPDPPSRFALPIDLIAALPDAEAQVSFAAIALLSGAEVGRGSAGPITVEPHRIVELALLLTPEGSDGAPPPADGALASADLLGGDGGQPDQSAHDAALLDGALLDGAALDGGGDGGQCSANGVACTSSCDCCSQYCLSGQCVPLDNCGISADPCKTGGDCCSGSCFMGLCVGGGYPPCHPCSSASQCSGAWTTCSNGRCCFQDNEPGCLVDGECCVGRCVSGTCRSACFAGGAICKSDGDCCGGLCTQGTCRCAQPAEACTSSSRCCAGNSCVGGQCVNTCSTGFHNCGVPCVSDSDPATCGSSCSACPQPASSVATCTAGICGFQCNTGYHSCFGGCWADSDATHCGASCATCSTTVANAIAACNGGACGFNCNSGYHACGQSCASTSDWSHCGPSCSACTPVANATPVCDGTCAVVCNPGFLACGGQCVVESYKSCGASCAVCGPMSLPPHAGRACVAHACSFVCMPGYALCGGACVDTQWSSAHCGGCGTACSAGQSCLHGLCVQTCSGKVGFGPFAVQRASGFAGLPGAIAIGDFDKDGKLDLAVGESGGMQVGLGAGDGTFTFSSLYPTNPTNSQEPSQMAAADLDQDGFLDVVVGGPEGTLHAYYNKGNGTFNPDVAQANAGAQFGLAVVDLNGDGKPDVPVADRTTNPASSTSFIDAFTMTMPRKLSQTPPFPAHSATVTQFSWKLAAGDLDRDGKQDLVAGHFRTALDRMNGAQPQPLSILLGNGDFSFKPEALAGPAPAEMVAPVVIDVNGDGKLDVVAGGIGEVVVMLGNGDGTFGTTVPISIAGSLFGTRVADIDGDGKLDIVVVGYETNSLSLLLGNGNGTFGSPLTVQTDQFPRDVAVGDFNGDGLADLAVTCEGNGATLPSIDVLLNRGVRVTQPIYPAPNYVDSTVLAADLNGDRRLDLALAFTPGGAATDDLALMTQLAGGGFSTWQAVPVKSDLRWMALADYNEDGKLDALLGSKMNLGVGDGTVQPGFDVGFTFESAIADVNNDGHLDVIDRSRLLYFGVGNGTFQTPIPVQSQYFRVVGDFNGDGFTDLVHGSILLGNGDGTFTMGTPLPTSGVGEFVSGDFDENGILDLADLAAVGFEIALGNGDGTFKSTVSYPAGVVPQYANVTDANGDGHQDLMALDVENNHVMLFLGVGDGTFRAPLSFQAPASTFNAMVTGDFTGDGRPDVLLADGQYLWILTGQCR